MAAMAAAQVEMARTRLVAEGFASTHQGRALGVGEPDRTA
jgi:hypothetical protein